MPFNKGGVFLGSLRFYDFLVYAFSFMEFFMVVELNVGTRDVARLRFSDYFKVQILLRKSEKNVPSVLYQTLNREGRLFQEGYSFQGEWLETYSDETLFSGRSFERILIR